MVNRSLQEISKIFIAFAANAFTQDIPFSIILHNLNNLHSIEKNQRFIVGRYFDRNLRESQQSELNLYTQPNMIYGNGIQQRYNF